VRGGDVEQLTCCVAGAGRHQVDEGPRMGSERRPVEIVVRDETRMLLAAAAVEADAVHGWVRRARQPLEQAERRECHLCVLAAGTREGVAGREYVVHGHMLIDQPDGPVVTL
jgi:hypothetical protein